MGLTRTLYRARELYRGYKDVGAAVDCSWAGAIREDSAQRRENMDAIHVFTSLRRVFPDLHGQKGSRNGDFIRGSTQRWVRTHYLNSLTDSRTYIIFGST